MVLQTFSNFQQLVAEYEEPPFDVGTVSLTYGSLLFYKLGDGSLGCVDFANPSDADLEKLAKACLPATFGHNQQDVLDESYRKAGKMDAEAFATQFSPHDLGLVDVIYDNLLEGKRNIKDDPIEVELYKLNVYGPGAFFKPHVDTPRSEKMFGSLVLLLPTIHEGGSLVFRKDGKEWPFDLAKDVELAADEYAAIAPFAMFFSDVEHEVFPVVSGYRVTLTYNLYWKAQRDGFDVAPITRNSALKESLQHLLDDPDFLQGGGVIAFGLSHKYPFDPELTYASNIIHWLKGTDQGLKELCEELSLKVSTNAIYEQDHYPSKMCLLDDFYNFNNAGCVEKDMVRYLVEQEGREVCEEDERPEYARNPKDVVRMVWAKPLEEVNRFSSAYAYYGNEACLSYVYGEACMVATIPPAWKRRGNPEPELKAHSDSQSESSTE